MEDRYNLHIHGIFTLSRGQGWELLECQDFELNVPEAVGMRVRVHSRTGTCKGKTFVGRNLVLPVWPIMSSTILIK